MVLRFEYVLIRAYLDQYFEELKWDKKSSSDEFALAIVGEFHQWISYQ